MDGDDKCRWFYVLIDDWMVYEGKLGVIVVDVKKCNGQRGRASLGRRT
jgi:hypothetical protein